MEWSGEARARMHLPVLKLSSRLDISAIAVHAPPILDLVRVIHYGEEQVEHIIRPEEREEYNC